MEESTKIEVKKPAHVWMLIAAGAVVVAIASGVGAYLGSFSKELGSQIGGVSDALQTTGSAEPTSPVGQQPAQPAPSTPTPAPAPAEPPKPTLGKLLELHVGSSVSVAAPDNASTMTLTLVSIEKYGTTGFRAKVTSQVSQSKQNHTFTLAARSFTQGNFDVVMAGYSESAIGVVIDYKSF